MSFPSHGPSLNYKFLYTFFFWLPLGHGFEIHHLALNCYHSIRGLLLRRLARAPGLPLAVAELQVLDD